MHAKTLARLQGPPSYLLRKQELPIDDTPRRFRALTTMSRQLERKKVVRGRVLQARD